MRGEGNMKGRDYSLDVDFVITTLVFVIVLQVTLEIDTNTKQFLVRRVAEHL